MERSFYEEWESGITTFIQKRQNILCADKIRIFTMVHKYLPPLTNVDWLNDPGNLVDKGDGSSNMI